MFAQLDSNYRCCTRFEVLIFVDLITCREDYEFFNNFSYLRVFFFFLAPPRDRQVGICVLCQYPFYSPTLHHSTALPHSISYHWDIHILCVYSDLLWLFYYLLYPWVPRGPEGDDPVLKGNRGQSVFFMGEEADICRF